MRRIGIVLVCAGLIPSLAGALDSTAANDDGGLRTAREARLTALVPAYFYPAGRRLADWARLADAARSIPLEVILNPSSGPGKTQDPRYVAVVAALRRSGARVLAYVDSDYGRRTPAAVETDLRTYLNFYELDGFFIDRMANTPAAVDYYLSVRSLIRRIDPRLAVVGNPGSPTLPAYLDAADTLVTFEGSARIFADSEPRRAAPWIADKSPGRFGVIVHGVATVGAARDALARTRKIGSGSVYITDQEMPNPYLGLPVYWPDLVAAIRASNAFSGASDGPANPHH
jgi:hypothetical protein